MSAAEMARFEQERYYKEAVSIRCWDDEGKVAGLVAPRFRTYRPLLESVAVGARQARGLRKTDSF